MLSSLELKTLNLLEKIICNNWIKFKTNHAYYSLMQNKDMFDPNFICILPYTLTTTE